MFDLDTFKYYYNGFFFHQYEFLETITKTKRKM